MGYMEGSRFMGDCNSQAKGFVLDVLQHVLSDQILGYNREERYVRLDCKTVVRRTAAEGIAFHTVALAGLGRSLDRALSSDTPLRTTGFTTCGNIPVFMRDLWMRVFDREGVLLENPSAEAVRALRQVCYLSYKLELDYAEELKAKKIHDFIEVDASLTFDPEKLGPTAGLVVERAAVLIRRIFEGFNPKKITPRHGPGSVATGDTFHQKYRWKRFYRRLAKEYPYEENFYWSYSHLCDRLPYFEALEEHEDGCAAVCLVPKDSRGPRLISMEPLEYQWIQQGLGRAIVDWLESHPLTRGYVNFTDQTVNRELALQNSLSGNCDTLDMKDASDRVSLGLVKQLVPPQLYACLHAARTPRTKLPDGTVLPLRKFAPMGSALCFPIEALCFWALAVSQLDTRRQWDGTRKRGPVVYVYGDDLIVPHGALDQLKPVFEELHLKFNDDKCCHGKYFRESCGMDAFRGECVTPIRVKTHGSSPSALASLCAYASAFDAARYPTTAEFLYSVAERELGPLPWTSGNRLAYARNTSDAIVAANMTACIAKTRWNADYQRWEMLSWQPAAVVKRYGWSGWEELLRNYVENRTLHKDWVSVNHCPTHLVWRVDGLLPTRQCEYTVPRAVNKKRVWTSLIS